MQNANLEQFIKERAAQMRAAAGREMGTPTGAAGQAEATSGKAYVNMPMTGDVSAVWTPGQEKMWKCLELAQDHFIKHFNSADKTFDARALHAIAYAYMALKARD